MFHSLFYGSECIKVISVCIYFTVFFQKHFAQSLLMARGNKKGLIEIMKTCSGKYIIILILFCSISLITYYKFFSEINRARKLDPVGDGSSRNNTCLKSYFENDISKIQYNVNMLKSSGCLPAYKIFSSMYEVDVVNASQRFNAEFSKKMIGWLKNNSTMFKLAEFQTIFIIHDIILQKTTVFNPLRSKRPVSKSKNSIISYLKNISESSKVNCDFCKPFNLTAEDVFGRIQGKYSVSASNAFKLAKWHSLFIPYDHSIFDIDVHKFLDVFNTSLKWFKKVHTVDENALYPALFWDMFYHSGASQLHVHAQGVVGEKHYPGQFQDLLKAVQTFQQVHNSPYWNALIDIHEILGLTLRFGKTIIISPLVPRRSHELWLVNEKPTTEYFTLLFSIIKMYQEKLHEYCFSMAGALPVLDQKLRDPELSLPCVIYIGTRGDCSSPVSDVSTLELYLFNNVNTDPYKTIEVLSEYLENSSSLYNNNEELEEL